MLATVETPNTGEWVMELLVFVTPDFNISATTAQLVTGVNAEAADATHQQLAQQRDAMIAAMQKATAHLRRK